MRICFFMAALHRCLVATSIVSLRLMPQQQTRKRAPYGAQAILQAHFDLLVQLHDFLDASDWDGLYPDSLQQFACSRVSARTQAENQQAHKQRTNKHTEKSQHKHTEKSQHKRKHKQTQTQAHKNTNANTNAHTHTHIHTHIHTRTLSLMLSNS